MSTFIVEQFHTLYLWLLAFVPNLVKASIIAALGWHAAKWAKRFVEATADRLDWDKILWGYVGNLLRYLIVATVFISALNKAGFPVGSLLATFGISGVIIGLGARQSISNYFFGVMMLSARPFKQGDLIEFGPPPQIGVVREVKMTYTAVDTLDNVRLIVPNSVIWRNKITNFSVHTSRAIKITLSMPYDVDVDWAQDIALDVLKRHEAVLNDPKPRFTVSDVTANEVKAQLVAWSKVETMNVFGDVITQMRKEFETAGLAVKVPAQDIDLKRED